MVVPVVINDVTLLVVPPSPLGQARGGAGCSFAYRMAPIESQNDIPKPAINPVNAPWKVKLSINKRNSSRETLIVLHENSKYADQSVHPHSLICDFVIQYSKSIITCLAACKYYNNLTNRKTSAQFENQASDVCKGVVLCVKTLHFVGRNWRKEN